MFNAHEARQRAQQGQAAQRLINDLAPAALVAGSARGETVVRVDFPAMPLKPAANRLGRIHDRDICEALEESGHGTMALGCRKLLALGFSLSSALKADVQAIEGSFAEQVKSLQIDHLMLDYTKAQFSAKSSDPLLEGVKLQQAAHWRQEAQVQIALKQMEGSALALVEVAASRSQMSCRIAWRDISKGVLDPKQFERLATVLRAAGFQIDLVEAGTAFRVSW